MPTIKKSRTRITSWNVSLMLLSSESLTVSATVQKPWPNWATNSGDGCSPL
jgi:hypothetical protein